MAHRLYLIRHGATESTATNRVCGSSDVPLSAQGEAEMACVAEYFAGKELGAVYSSPLSRARNPAAALALARGVEHRVVAGLAEVDFGKWEGLTLMQVFLRWPVEAARTQAADATYTFPGGENIGAFQVRAVKALAEICDGLPGPAAVYTHGGVLRAIVGSLNGLSLPQAKALSFSTGSVTILEWAEGAHRVKDQNLYAHLSAAQKGSH